MRSHPWWAPSPPQTPPSWGTVHFMWFVFIWNFRWTPMVALCSVAQGTIHTPLPFLSSWWRNHIVFTSSGRPDCVGWSRAACSRNIPQISLLADWRYLATLNWGNTWAIIYRADSKSAGPDHNWYEETLNEETEGHRGKKFPNTLGPVRR